jgi:hypothetical protein
MTLAWACKVTKNNLAVIASESGPKFDRQFAENWLAEHGEGFFLRDEASPLDCHFFVPEVFQDFYVFAHDDDSSLFRKVIKK